MHLQVRHGPLFMSGVCIDVVVGPYLVTVQFGNEEEGMKSAVKGEDSSALFECYFAMLNITPAQKSEMGNPPRWLGMVSLQFPCSRCRYLFSSLGSLRRAEMANHGMWKDVVQD